MMATAPPITAKHRYGWKMEQLLRPYFEDCVGEELTPTEYRFDGCDLTSESWAVESKARPTYSFKYHTYQDENTYEEWLVPTCKEKVAEKKDLVFFYYWEASRKLFFCQYDKEVFATIRRGVPHWTSQEHFFIPKDLWVECCEVQTDTQ